MSTQTRKRHPLLTTFGENLRQARREQKISQAELAIMLNCDPSTYVRVISRIETGNENVTLETVQLLADALCIPPYRLLMNKDDLSRL